MIIIIEAQELETEKKHHVRDHDDVHYSLFIKDYSQNQGINNQKRDSICAAYSANITIYKM